jgi:hypothetical protein
MREKITFKPGAKVQAVIDQSQGKECEGNNGTQYMRVCDNDQRIMFCDPELEEAILQAGATAGDAIQIVKTVEGKGDSRFTTWDVAIISEFGQRAHEAAEAKKRPAPVTARTAAAAAAEKRNREIDERTARRNEELALQQQPLAVPPVITPASVELVAALKSAIDAAMEATRYAAMQAFPVTFSSEDIRTMANSIICRKEKGGR